MYARLHGSGCADSGILRARCWRQEEQTGSAGRIDRRKEFREEMQAERSSGGISEWDSKGNDFALHPEGISSQNVLRYRCRCAV